MAEARSDRPDPPDADARGALPGLARLGAALSAPFGVPPVGAQFSRAPELDGLRGWAALMVVGFHVFWETFGARYPVLRSPATAWLLDGSLAVSIFFVLSGEALSAGFLAGGGRRLVVDLALRRYPRLVLPVLGACAVVYALQALGLCRNAAAGRIVGRPDWLGGWLQTPITASEVLSFSTYEVFTRFDPGRAVDPFLWTMRLELIGSVVVFVALLSLHGSRRAWYAIAALYLFSNALRHGGGQLACFFAGVGLGQLRAAGAFARAHASGRVDGAMLAAAVLLLAIEAALRSTGAPDAGASLVASLLTATVFLSRSLSRLMRAGPSRFLGRISFPLFLVQFPVLVSLTSDLIVRADAIHVLGARVAVLIGLASVAASVLAAWAFEPIERSARWLSRRLAHAILAAWARRGPTRDPGRCADRPHEIDRSRSSTRSSAG